MKRDVQPFSSTKTMVMAVYALDSDKDLEQYEACISTVLNVLREGRRGGAKKFYISGDLNVELGMMCTDEDDIEELNEIYGSLCWQGHKHDPGGHQQFMWYSIMKEFKCKKSSTWSSYKERERERRPSRTDNMGMKKKRNLSWITSSGRRTVLMIFTSATITKHGLRGTTIRSMQ